MAEPPMNTRSLFTAAIALPADERIAFVQRASVPDEVKAQVQELLKHHRDEGDDFLEPHQGTAWKEEPRWIEHYRIDSRIAAGGMGVVYLGTDTRLNRKVAIKVLNPILHDADDARERLIHEAKVTAKLKHPGIVPVFDVVITSSVVAIISQYIDGPTLESRIKDRTTDHLQSFDEDAEIVRQIALALDHAHASRVVHRDLKPSNVILDRDSGTPMLTDFGIAKLLSQTEVLHTSAGAGTCYYMSPEQTKEHSDDITPASDVFSLGIIFYQLLTGARPYNGPTRDVVIEKIREGSVRPPRELNPAIPRDLELVCLKMLEPEMTYRYATCRELVDDLERFQQGVPVLASPPSLARRARELVYSRRQMLTVSGVLIASLAAGGYGVYRLFDTRRLMTIVTDSRDARITVHKWNPLTFRFTPYSRGRGSTHNVRVGEGMYRIAVETPQGFLEYDRIITSESTDIEVQTTSKVADTTDMVRIELTDPTLLELGDPEFQSRVRDVRPFLIDQHEVSCGQYKKFVDETGHPRPPIWPTPYDPAWDTLPVTTVTADDARAYAEWCGKRLPTVSEWYLAARGTSGDRYPWGNEPPEIVSLEDWARQREDSYGNWGFVDRRTKNRVPINDVLRDYVRTSLWPVDLQSKDCRTWGDTNSKNRAGTVFNLLGNVSEWTSSPFNLRTPTDQVPTNYDMRFVCGQPWAEEVDYREFINLADNHIGDWANQQLIGRGFRCALSLRE